LRHFEVTGVFALISVSMVMVMGAIGIFGPRTNNRNLDEISQ
jgi:putative MFS transporter